jgi:predicted aspartyl protease
MTFSFNPESGLVLVQALIIGPNGKATINLALDTGASKTLINEDILLSLGYDRSQAVAQSKITTGSKVESVALIKLKSLFALNQERTGLIVVCHTLPPSANIDGLLGLDFFRSTNLNLDFRAGEITLT